MKSHSSSSSYKGIMLYDFLYCMGGAEKVTIELARGIPNTDICVGFRDKKVFTDQFLNGINCWEIGKDQKFDISAYRTLSSIYVFSKKLPFLKKYDWAIFSGSYAPIAVHNRPNKRNICYCHTIPRFAYDLQKYYLKILPFWKIPVFRLVSAYIRNIYKRAMMKMDTIVANSENVRKRINKYIGLDAIVVYPPCDVSNYKWIDQEDYYLSTARIEKYKRVELIIEAFKEMPDKKLVVASGGSEYLRLKKLSENKKNIVFTGWTDEKELKRIVGRSIATIYIPKDEDFGMSPVESMASGKPVIGVSEGGLLETIIHNQTGFLIPENPRKEHIIKAVESMTNERAINMRTACETNAQKFSRRQFMDMMYRIINE